MNEKREELKRNTREKSSRERSRHLIEPASSFKKNIILNTTKDWIVLDDCSTNLRDYPYGVWAKELFPTWKRSEI